MSKIKEINQLHRQTMAFANDAYAADLKSDFTTAAKLHLVQVAEEIIQLLASDPNAALKITPSKSIPSSPNASQTKSNEPFQKTQRVSGLRRRLGSKESLTPALNQIFEQTYNCF